ncbi:MAG: hypothetical protein EA366_01080 [Spirulina sp. DLM2.Bin59]|nr:MAG: hypothetical protein EA366_01080 [Spirulina sp. DLM2.Bin59]
MALHEIQNQALQLPIGDRWRLVQSLLNSIQQETLALSPPKSVDSFRDYLDAEFEAIADRLADEFQTYVGATTPSRSDYAVSRAGIYEDHP